MLRVIIACILNLFLVVACVAQPDCPFKIKNSKGDYVNFCEKDVQLKYLLSNEFARLITGNSYAGIGNYAAFSTTDNTLSGSVNIIMPKTILDIDVAGSVTDGVSTLFRKSDLATGVTLGISMHFMIGEGEIAVNAINITNIDKQAEQLFNTFVTDSIKALSFQYSQNEKIQAKQKEIDELNEKILSNRHDPKKEEAYLKYLDVLEYELKALRDEVERHRNHLDEVMNSLRSVKPFDQEKFRIDSLKALAFEFTFEKKIKEKMKEIDEIKNQMKANQHDPSKDSLYNAQKVLLEREMTILKDDLQRNKAKIQSILGELRYNMELAREKVWSQIDAILAEDIKIRWLTTGGQLTQNTYKLYDQTRDVKDRVQNSSDLTPSFTLAISGFANVPGRIGGGKSRHVTFYSLGINGKVGNNFSTLESVDVTTTDSVSVSQSLIKVESAYVGEFDKNDFSCTIFGDYYRFVGHRNNVGFHLRTTVDAGASFKPVTSFRAGLVIPFTKIADKASFLNLELFVGINDVFERAKSGSAFDKNIAGLQATFPINFKIL